MCPWSEPKHWHNQQISKAMHTLLPGYQSLPMPVQLHYTQFQHLVPLQAQLNLMKRQLVRRTISSHESILLVHVQNVICCICESQCTWAYIPYLILLRQLPRLPEQLLTSQYQLQTVLPTGPERLSAQLVLLHWDSLHFHTPSLEDE